MSVGGEGARRLVPEKIGKYRVVDRIGRGGMGMIFKAHDPILDRQVALKVISPEVEVTDELRTRFFREAKACAKLNHPNIVTVYDMGEDEGRLFIVMELLEGDELRQVIKANPTLILEEKLSVMLQVCSGLHYAHQKGVIHRDMKPGNVFLLRNGHVKILDFGIAHIATTEAGLTRTGLIMGTLRYISPEQVRGRVDHRSDIFSIGSVFYELLTSRPPFLGDDALQLLEQLRTEEPPSPTEIDPSIPSDLTAVVQRAMRKDPDDRFHDLEEMRVELEAVHARLLEERQGVFARIRRQRDRLAQLQAVLAERVGTPGDDTPIRAISERHGLTVAQAAEREFAGRIEAMEAKIAQAEALAPAFQRAHELLDTGGFQDAAEQLESIVAKMPDHQRARESLDRARAQADAQRQRQQAVDLLQQARAALDDQRFALCLELLKQAAAISVPEPLTEEIAALRQTALAGQEAQRRSRNEVEEAHAQMVKARGDAQAADAAQHAPGPWNEAEASAATAQADLGREAHAEAKRGFARAAAAYRRALDAARQEHSEERRAAGRARETAVQSQRQAQGVGATQYARELWDVAEARFAEAQAVFAKTPSARAGSAFSEASALYRRAEEAARETRDREHRRADAARERVTEGRRSAETMDAEHHVPTVWQEAVAKAAEGEAALLRQQYGKAADAFVAALGLYHQAQTQVRDLLRGQREEARKKQQDMAERRRGAMAVEAASQQAADWNEAEANAAAGDGALSREAWEEAGHAFDQAATLYRRAEERSREALRARADAAAQAAGLAAAGRPSAETPAPPARAPVAPVDTPVRQAEDPGRRPVFDDAPTVLIRPTETVKPSTVVPERKTAAAPATASTPSAPRVPSPVSDDAKKPAPPSRRLRIRAVAAGAGVLAALAVIGFWWRSASPPASPPAATQPLAAPPTTAPPIAAPSQPPARRDDAPPPPSQTSAARDEAAPVESAREPAKRPSEPVVATAPPPPRPRPTDTGRATPAKPAQPGAAQPPAPSMIRGSVEQTLRDAKLLRTPNSDEAGVAVEDVGADGSVRLVGVLRNAAARQAAADLVRTVAGVTSVDVRRVTVREGWLSQ